MSSVSQYSFSPTGPKVQLIANNPVGTATQVPVDEGQTDFGQYLIVNKGSVIVYLGYGSSSGKATTNAVSGSGYNWTLMPGATMVLRMSARTWFAGLAASAGAVNVDITPGAGL